jgi:hypothetical protein
MHPQVRVPRFKLLDPMTALVYLPIALMVSLLIGGLIQAGSYWLYDSWYLHSCTLNAKEAALEGRPEKDVVSVLGQPSYTKPRSEFESSDRIYVYESGVGSSIFEVSCKQGIVKGFWVDD